MILLDTHALIWFLTDPTQLSLLAITTIEQTLKTGKIMISSISIWEICLLVQKKKVHFTQSLQQTLSTIYSMTELEFIPIDNRIAELSQTLPGRFHKDPADRFIVATALTTGATLITKDDKIRKYTHIKTLW